MPSSSIWHGRVGCPSWLHSRWTQNRIAPLAWPTQRPPVRACPRALLPLAQFLDQAMLGFTWLVNNLSAV
eukprot:4434325-Pyramimonas_sp.AAC.1